MRRLLTLTLLLSTAFGAAVLANKDPQPATRPTTAPASQPAAGKPINKFCPIEPDNEIDPKLTTTYKGKTIGVCCQDCIAQFHKDPEGYMKKIK